MSDAPDLLNRSLTNRYGSLSFESTAVAGSMLQQMAGRSSCRRFSDKSVDDALIDLLCAVALASPTKSDLQQRDIIIVQDSTLRNDVNQLFGDGSWIASAPVLLVFCGNNRRQRQLAEWREKPFPNDHLDAFFNASVDAAIALSAFVTAAESAGLGCCPISEIRNHCSAISQMLKLPQHVFPVAGLAAGWPQQAAPVSLRLPLSVTVHRDSFSEIDVQAQVDDYDRRRREQQPYKQQRDVDRFGESATYGWSEDKARQYTVAQRTDFAAFIKAKGFILD